jgi:exodeoxyribonuclease VII large subunit
MNHYSPIQTSRDKPWSVGELTLQMRELLNETFSNVWVAGELSGVKYHQNGHLYCVLKDAEAQLPAVIWRSTLARLKFELEHGQEVICCGKVDVYPPHGKYQFIIEQIQPKGMGALELAFQQLKEKLEKRGWFAAERKKPLPRFPRRIALVTSSTGAAVRDMLRIIPRRWPAVEILVCPVAVQGANAVPEIAAAIRLVNQLRCADVMIVGRGGGSLEDLWAFNEEPVAEAIFRSAIPIISAVGHETDFTIADFVADRRAATPSEAAELVVPDCQEILGLLAETRRRLGLLLSDRIRLGRERVERLAGRRVFVRPLDHVHDRAQKLDDWEDRLRRAVQVDVERRRQTLAALAGKLESLSPLGVLGRGYSLTWKEGGTALLRDASEVQVGERIVTRLAAGELVSRVEGVQTKTKEAAP